MYNRSVIKEKTREAMASVLPITAIVAVLCFALVPMESGLMLSFLLGAAMLVLGMGLFTLGAEMSMSRIGNLIGAGMTKSRKLGLILLLSFLLGAAVTMAEPDLQVLAANVPGINKTVLIAAVSLGVGAFLALCMLRILVSMSLRLLLILFYATVFALACFMDTGLLSIAFDSGGNFLQTIAFLQFNIHHSSVNTCAGRNGHRQGVFDSLYRFYGNGMPHAHAGTEVGISNSFGCTRLH